MNSSTFKYSLAFSSCPNDTFIFKAIAKHLIAGAGYDFNIFIDDVETLNQQAANAVYDVTKLSFATLGNLLDQYALLRSGSALGKGCGPLIVSNPDRKLDDKQSPVVAVPGMGTTAYYLFQFFLKETFPQLTPSVVPMAFDKVMPHVTSGKADFGLIIHEGRFVFPTFGLKMQIDLGQWWEQTTSLPIPLGCIAVKRQIAHKTALDIQSLIRQSIEHAFQHPDAAYDYIQNHAQEMEPDVIQQHIDLYVNDFSLDIGNDGEKAIEAFFKKAHQAGLMDETRRPLFIG